MGALEKDYEVLERLGEGAFGKVHKARHKKSEDVVAVKQIKLGAKSWDEAMRSTELAALRQLRHPFIVRLRELLRSQWDGSLYYIFEYVDSNLSHLVSHNPQGMDEMSAAVIARQLFAGIAHVHLHNFFHRDIKPENVLYDTRTEMVRIADFGEARSVRARPPFTDYVGTRWYRAPECLLRDRSYSAPVDVWGSGLVYAELLRGSPIFTGSSSIDQLYKIFSVLGQEIRDWPEFSRLAEACRFRVPQERGCGLQSVIPRAPPRAVAVVTEILVLNPRRRPFARKVLEHNYFSLLPPLDVDRLDTSRSSAAASNGEVRSSVIERSDSRHSLLSHAAAAGAAAGGELDSAAAAQASSEATAARALQDHESTVDIDLDAELDKILGGEPSHSSSLNQGSSPPFLRPSRSTESFSFAPGSRSPPPPQMMEDGSIFSGDADRQAGAASRIASPDSPGGIMDALLNDLADLGVGDDVAPAGSVRSVGLGGGAGAYADVSQREDVSMSSPDLLASNTFCLHDFSSTSTSPQLPWSPEEAMQLRRVVKKVVRLGARDKDSIWLEVSREMGGLRGPQDCKLQYARDYKADKLRKASGNDGGTHPAAPC
eukprot:TRINITY_DN8975_c0_g1_i1.p1 TRINITY_DN8975_c0_g1~~TRINITY_DN8975_c0_g1_i1.p1  ORF type:complete len:599 (+),score=118.26 TRINITY_DN8975_c0_g1_i1:118-1914(+)